MGRTLLGGPCWAVLALVAAATPAAAQPEVTPVVPPGDGPGIVVVLDADDEDENGVSDGVQIAAIPPRDVVMLHVTPRSGAATVIATHGLRIVVDGRVAATPLTVPPGAPTAIGVQGVSTPSSRGGDRSVTVTDRSGSTRVPVTVVGLRFRNGRSTLDGSRDAAALSHAITNDATLPRGAGDWAQASPDPDNLQVEVRDPGRTGGEITLRSRRRLDGAQRDERTRLPLRSPTGADAWHRGPWMRLVGDPFDARAPGVGDRVLIVGLRDRLVAGYRPRAGGPVLSQELAVGRPGPEAGPLAARRGRLRIRVLRHVPGGRPTIGTSDAEAVRLAREQIRIANEIWMQCMVDFGDPDRADVAVVDPPPPSLLVIGEDDGLLAAGDGQIRLRVDGRAMPTVTTVPGATPTDTALAVAAALASMGFDPVVSANARTTRGALGSADVLVRHRDGSLAELSVDGDTPIGTDRQQTVAIAAVDLRDGLDDFDNLNASSGTPEERALMKAVADDDPGTVDIVIVNRFESGFRQGEAFIEGDGGAIINGLILDRSGILQQRAAWTQSHELGHVLLDHPLHPDNVGPDRPWLLMDADASLATVEGPKRLTAGECARARARSGVATVPVLLDHHPE